MSIWLMTWQMLIFELTATNDAKVLGNSLLPQSTSTIMVFKDPLDPLNVPAPRHEYYSDDEDDGKVTPSPPKASDFTVEWETHAESSSATSSRLQVLVCVGAVTRPLSYGLLNGRSSRKGKMVVRDVGVLDLETTDNGLLLVSTREHLPADWQHAAATTLLQSSSEMAHGAGFDLTILDSYVPQTYVHTEPTPYLPNPPVRYLRAGFKESLPAADGLAPYNSPNYVTGLAAALINAATHPSNPQPTPTTLLLLPTPLHPSQLLSALGFLPDPQPTSLRHGLESIWRPVSSSDRVWDDEEVILDESGGRVDNHAFRKARAKKQVTAVAELGEGGMYI